MLVRKPSSHTKKYSYISYAFNDIKQILKHSKWGEEISYLLNSEQDVKHSSVIEDNLSLFIVVVKSRVVIFLTAVK